MLMCPLCAAVQQASLHAVALCPQLSPCVGTGQTGSVEHLFQLPSFAVQITIVGDFDPEDLEESFRKYFGTLAPANEPLPLPHAPVRFVMDAPLSERHQVRACRRELLVVMATCVSA